MESLQKKKQKINNNKQKINKINNNTKTCSMWGSLPQNVINKITNHPRLSKENKMRVGIALGPNEAKKAAAKSLIKYFQHGDVFPDNVDFFVSLFKHMQIRPRYMYPHTHTYYIDMGAALYLSVGKAGFKNNTYSHLVQWIGEPIPFFGPSSPSTNSDEDDDSSDEDDESSDEEVADEEVARPRRYSKKFLSHLQQMLERGDTRIQEAFQDVIERLGQNNPDVILVIQTIIKRWSAWAQLGIDKGKILNLNLNLNDKKFVRNHEQTYISMLKSFRDYNKYTRDLRLILQRQAFRLYRPGGLLRDINKISEMFDLKTSLGRDRAFPYFEIMKPNTKLYIDQETYDVDTISNQIQGKGNSGADNQNQNLFLYHTIAAGKPFYGATNAINASHNTLSQLWQHRYARPESFQFANYQGLGSLEVYNNRLGEIKYADRLRRIYQHLQQLGLELIPVI